MPELGRRQFLRGVAVTGVVASTGGILAACSSSSNLLGDDPQSQYGG